MFEMSHKHGLNLINNLTNCSLIILNIGNIYLKPYKFVATKEQTSILAH